MQFEFIKRLKKFIKSIKMKGLMKFLKKKLLKEYNNKLKRNLITKIKTLLYMVLFSYGIILY